MPTIEDWAGAQVSADSSGDWRSVDRLAIKVSKQGFTGNLAPALRLAILRRRGTTGLPIDDGDAKETWIDHFLQAVWDAVRDLESDRSAFLNLPFATHSLGRDNKIIAVSKKWCDLLGYCVDEIIGRRSFEFMDDESRNLAISRLPKFWETGIARTRYNFVHKTGRLVPVILSGTAEFDTEGVPLRSFAILSPVKEF